MIQSCRNNMIDPSTVFLRAHAQFRQCKRVVALRNNDHSGNAVLKHGHTHQPVTDSSSPSLTLS